MKSTLIGNFNRRPTGEPRRGMGDLAHAGTPSDKRLEGLSTIECLRHTGRARRFHNQPSIIGQQTVAEHTYNVLTLVVHLWGHDSGIPPRNLLLAALYHDAAEGEVGDIPAPAKWAYPALRVACEEAEECVLERMGLLEPFVNLDTEQENFLKACDWLEGMQFCRDQRALGNVGIEGIFWRWAEGLSEIIARHPMPSKSRDTVYLFFLGLMEEFCELTGKTHEMQLPSLTPEQVIP